MAQGEKVVPDAEAAQALGARLRKAREARGWTQAEVAERLGIARTTLVAIEQGQRQVRAEELIELAGLYGRSVSELLQAPAPVEAFGVQLRSAMRQGPEDSRLLEGIDEFERLADDYLLIEQLRGAPLPRRDTPQYDLAGVAPELLAEDVAASERQRLGLGDGPLPDLRELLESQVGLRVFHLDLPSEVAGLFAYTEEHGGCVAVNRRHPAERRRHSLTHEYGHYLTNRFRPEIMVQERYERRPREERFAETFGRAFLMPGSGVRRRFLQVKRERGGHPTHGDLCRLAHAYAVSVEAMARRLEELDLVPAGTWDRLLLAGFKPREAQQQLGLPPHDFGNEVVSPRFTLLVIEGWQEGELTEGQVSRLLRLSRIEARRVLDELTAEHQDVQLAQPLVDRGSA